MASPLPSSFASAAAGNNSHTSGGRWNDSSTGSDWSRSRPNGATQTFRRTSANPIPAREPSSATSVSTGSGIYLPPHVTSTNVGSARNGMNGESRYTKEQMLQIYQGQKASGNLRKDLTRLFEGTWDPTKSTSADGGSWSKYENKDVTIGPDVCWDSAAGNLPLGLVDMTDDERTIFSTSVNASVKVQQTNVKDSPVTTGTANRKTSLSNAFGSSAVGGARPSGRRREPSDSFQPNGPLSPSYTKQGFFRDDPAVNTPPPALLRRRTDYKEESGDVQTNSRALDSSTGRRDDEEDPPFTSLKRSTTGPSASAFGSSSSSPWSAAPTSSAFASMGSFGSFNTGSSSTPQDTEKRSGFGSGRNASRFKDLLSKASSEDSPSVKQKSSVGNLGRLPEDEGEDYRTGPPDSLRTRPGRSETNPYEDNSFPRTSGLGTQNPGMPVQGISELGFSSFSSASVSHPNDASQKSRPSSGYQQTPIGRYQAYEPMSPASTNPFQSPAAHLVDDDQDDPSLSHPSAAAAFGSVRRNMPSSTDDRGPNLHIPGGMNAGAAWPTTSLGSGTPGRERNTMSSAFGDSIFSPLSDVHSPGASAFGGSSAFMSNPPRSSKLGGLFPPAMQEQMTGDNSQFTHEQGYSSFDRKPEGFQSLRDAFDGTTRARDLSFEDMQQMPESEMGSPLGIPLGLFGSSMLGTSNISGPPSGLTQKIPLASTEPGPPSGRDQSPSSGSSSTNQLPAVQQRTMVMPDRMRWIYRDPQGNTQGPWSGLEMHDWFKAGFFTAELQVKRVEDGDFEPLAQLVRRIGNSREPFLVPQIGIPHGPAPSSQTSHWATAGPGPAAPGGAPPPFASSFPSFGTTLTAEQQNALERRKQEEQFLMARQKEHLAQQQALMKQMQINGPHGLHSLQHHSSAHSLHSQPSFGSITSPSAYQPSPLPAPIQPPQHRSGFDMNRPPPTSNMGLPPHLREESLHKYMDQLSFNQRASGAPLPSDLSNLPTDQLSAMLDRSRIQGDLQGPDVRAHQEAFLGPEGRNERLNEFNAFQAEAESGMRPESYQQPPIGFQKRSYDPDESRSTAQADFGAIGQPERRDPETQYAEALSLTQQVQRAAAISNQATNEASAIAVPPVSISPLPAPAAQRNRQHVADALAAESRSTAQTPIQTPTTSLAPWAEKVTEVLKGPSLKEIQEAESRKAAAQEEIAASVRRAKAEAERNNQPLPPAPGLPSSSTWGSAGSPSTQVAPSASVWAKQAVPKANGAQANGNPKKTLAQIQKEEETRKQRLAATTAAIAQATSPAAAANKRYAELASKPAASTGDAAPSPWTTVGSGGKAKAPPTVVATPQITTSKAAVVSSNSVKAKPTLQTTRSTNTVNQSKAQEDFSKWAKGQLGGHLNKNINADDFMQTLLALPSEVDIIFDSVYTSSPTLDRRFAEEFVRRRKLADKGVVDSAQSSSATATTETKAQGWSEVAKKGPVVKEDNSYKVVTKKKGKR